MSVQLLKGRQIMDDIIKVETNIYDKCTIYTNCIVQVLENTVTNEVTFGWYKTEDTEEIPQ